MFRQVVAIAVVASVAAFAPAGRVARSSAISMGAEDLIGAPASAEVGGLPASGYWDPLNLAKDKDDKTLSFYRAAELKHGRVAMVASLGVIIQGLNTGILPNPTFSETNLYEAVKRVYYENPGALIQIIIAIAAVEVLTASIESPTRPGDFGWDPANIRPKDDAKLDELQLKELKNGRLAMLSIAGMAYQAALTGQGTIEQLTSGHISPFGDGQGFF